VSGRFKFALGEVVKNVDDIKKSASIRTENGISVGAIQTKLAAQSPITKKLVAKFRPKEDEKT
jgi:hypothetical protein